VPLLFPKWIVKGMEFGRYGSNRTLLFSVFANVYSGPILAVSMFADHDVERTQDILRKVTTIQESGRDNIVFINGRAYVPEIGECATDKSDTVGTCSKDFRTAKNRGKNGHRCVGENGGHPDLVAWDVVEECYRLMSYD